MTDETSDAAAYKLLERIAEKAAELFNDSDPTKTVAEWRQEMASLTGEAVFFVAARRKNPHSGGEGK